MGSRETVAIELTGRRLRAVEIAPRAGGLIIRRTLVDDVPVSIELTDIEALGTWIRGRLTDAGIGRRNVVWQLGREHVVIKRLVLPTTVADELPDMTRLAMMRELPFSAADVVIDYVPMQTTGRDTIVLASAAPAEELGRQRAIAKAAGCTIARLSLRSLGTAALVQTDPRTSSERVLAIDVTRGRSDFSVLDHEGIRFVRSAELGGQESVDDTLAALATETQRTWMSYRMTDDTHDIARVVLFGDHDLLEPASAQIERALSRPTELFHDHAHVTATDVSAEHVWPLVGQLLIPIRNLDTIDFASPRKPRDHTAHRRKLVLAGAGALAVLMLAGWTFAHRELNELTRQRDALRDTSKTLGEKYAVCIRDGDQLTHIDRWLAVDEEWLDHVTYLCDLAPETESLVFDGWTGSIDFRGVQYDRKTKTWSQPATLSIEVTGEARDRSIADAFRAALVASKRYITSSS
ncbi:MAG: pilus assembly protein PilM, partial [Phycisphaerales bacterium]|nr:pilus assembly protein PilM [Phycisphaerales bacterium]